MSVIQLSNGSTIRTFTLPPEGFDPLTASDAELAVYGFPARPENPFLRERFEDHYKRVKGRMRYIEPAFTVHPSRRPRVTLVEGAAGNAQDFWSGAVVYAPSGQSFKWVQSQWVVPNVSAKVGSTIGSTENAYVEVAWVGLGNSSLLQAGSGSQISPGGEPSFFMWHEWTPPGWVTVNNFPLSGGDLVAVVICTPSGVGSTSATVYFSNLTQGVQTSYPLSFPEGSNDPSEFLGDQAEWIVERPVVPGGLAVLPNFGQVIFTHCTATLTDGTVVDAGTTGGRNGTLNMSPNNVLLSTATLIAPEVLQVEYNATTTGIVNN